MQDQARSQVLEKSRLAPRDGLPKTVSRGAGGWQEGEVSLYAPNGERKYLNVHERDRVLEALSTFERIRSLFGRVLIWSGARVSEVLALTAASFQIETGVVAIRTLKQRKFVVREVPLPPRLMADLQSFFSLRELQRDGCRSSQRLWLWSRVTVWRFIKRAMTHANVFGVRACPRGLRHCFGVASIVNGVAETVLQTWMGHARLSTTAIYTRVCGPEMIALAHRLWAGGPEAVEVSPAIQPARCADVP